MAGVNVPLNSGHEAVGSCHRERVGAWGSDKDRGEAKKKSGPAGEAGACFHNRLSEWDTTYLECLESN